MGGLISGRDLVAVLLSGVWVLSAIGLAEWLRRRVGVPRPWTRKLVHVAVGSWVLPTFLLFDTRFWAAFPPATFIVVNALSHRHGWMKSVEGDRGNYGSIFYPFSVSLLVWMGWPDPVGQACAAAGVLVLAWGDAAASQVGRAVGRRSYHVRGHERTLEGSAAMFAFSVAGILAAAAVLLPAWPGGSFVAVALLVALFATTLEGISLHGVDNLLVPIGSAGALWLLRGWWA